jgi:hypothetical protein
LERKAVSGIMLTLLLIGMSALALDIQPVRSIDERVVKVYRFGQVPIIVHGDDRYLYYSVDDGGVYRVDRNTGVEELLFDKGRDLIFAEGDYLYVGDCGYWTRTYRTTVWKLDKATGNILWSVTSYYYNSYSMAIGKYAIYARGASDGSARILKEDGTIEWISQGVTRYLDDALPDLKKNDVLIEAGWWSPNTIQRTSKVDGSIIWQRKGPTEEMGEVTRPIDITDDTIWIQWFKGTYPNQYFYALAKWDRDTGALIEAFPDKPYDRIWHLGPEGSLIFDYPDEAGNALVYNPDMRELSKVNSQTWEVYWTTDIGYPMMYVVENPERPFIDGDYIYLRDWDDRTTVYQFLWRAPAGASADLVRRASWPEHHHFVLSKDGDPSVDDRHGTPGNQTLYGLVKNTGNVTLPAGTYKVVWNITGSTGLTIIAETTGVIDLPPGEITLLTYDLPAIKLTPDKYNVEARCYYYGTEGGKTKAFSFTVVS